MMNTRQIAVFAILASGALSFLTRDSQAQRVEERYATISVVGEAVASAPPDQATVRFGVVTRDDDPEVARRENAEAARRAMDAVRELIPNDEAMRLENLSLQPAREYDPETRRYIELGFEAQRFVVVEVADLDVLPTLIARIVEEGANRLHGVTYELENQDSVRSLALERAMANATAKAETMAAAAGVTVGRVLRIAEQGTTMPIPVMRDMAMAEFGMAKAAEPVPEAYAPGLIEVRASVEVMFAISGEGE